MLEQKLQIHSNEKIAKDIFKMVLSCDTSAIAQPGQFINISIEDKFLRRPISICDWDDSSITIIYKVVGEGTKWLSEQPPNNTLKALIALGNGFALSGQEQLVVGGGIGVPPLLGVCKALNSKGIQPKIVLGFLTKEDVILEKEFSELGDLTVATDDGSYGTKGLVTDIIINEDLAGLQYVACGPLPMEKALKRLMNATGKLSLEARLGCGHGACMGCSIETKNGPKRICKEGPVFESEELLW